VDVAHRDGIGGGGVGEEWLAAVAASRTLSGRVVDGEREWEGKQELVVELDPKQENSKCHYSLG
jgi:hypothetical protein